MCVSVKEGGRNGGLRNKSRERGNEERIISPPVLFLNVCISGAKEQKKKKLSAHKCVLALCECFTSVQSQLLWLHPSYLSSLAASLTLSDSPSRLLFHYTL